MIWERIWKRILSWYSVESFRVLTNSLAKSVGEILSFDKSQSNLSLMTVFSSRGISISIDTNFLSSVNLFNPSFGLFVRSLCLSSLL